MDSSKLPLEARVAEAHDAAGRMMRTTKIVAGAKVYHHPLSFTVSEASQHDRMISETLIETNHLQQVCNIAIQYPPDSLDSIYIAAPRKRRKRYLMRSATTQRSTWPS